MSAAREASVSQIKKAPLSSDKPSRGNELLGILHEISKSSSAAGGPDASIMPMFDPQSARHSSVPSPTTVFPLNLPPGMVQPIQEPE
jgi:hypothetical protein